MTNGGMSDAALCHVTVSKDVVARDLLLDIVLKLVQLRTHQVFITYSNDRNVLRLVIGGGDATAAGAVANALTQRNAILRSLLGPALHGSMDKCHASNVCWSGGLLSTAGSAHGSSVPAALNAASLNQWMSVADQIRSNSDTLTSDILQQLDDILETSAFVLPYTPTVTLADLDLCLALLSRTVDCEDPSNVPRTVHRWFKQVVAVLVEVAAETGVSLAPTVTIPSWLSSPPSRALEQPPICFTGTEHSAELLAALYKNTAVAPKAVVGHKGDGHKAAVSTEDVTNVTASSEKKGKMTKQDKKAAMAVDGKKEKTAIAAAVVEAPLDIMSLDIRVGKIIKVWPHETADKLFCEEIDLGHGEIRNIASGLRPFYKVEDLQDRVVLVLCNLKKRTLVGFPSHGMVLCASNADHTAVEFVVPPPSTPLGERVVFDGLNATQAPEPESKVAKKKLFEALAPDLQTDGTGRVVWKTHRAQTTLGPVVASNGMAHASVS